MWDWADLCHDERDPDLTAEDGGDAVEEVETGDQWEDDHPEPAKGLSLTKVPQKGPLL